MGAEGRYDLQLADNDNAATTAATTAATPQGEGQSTVQNEQQQEVWLMEDVFCMCMYVFVFFK